MPPRVRIDIAFGKPEVDHKDGFFLGFQSDSTVPKLYIAMQNFAVVHDLQACDLHI
jgi:hypothetical protein